MAEELEIKESQVTKPFGLARRIYKTFNWFNFTPLSVDSLRGWWDAGFGVTKDGSDNVSQINDKSGNGRRATQGTGANQPTFIADGGAGFNNRPVIRFTTDFMEIADFDYGDFTKLNVFAVWSHNDSLVDQTIISHFAIPNELAFRHDVAETVPIKVRTDLSENGIVLAKTYDTATTIVAGTVYLSSFEYDVNTLNLYTNGVLETPTKVNDVVMTTLLNSTSALRLGAVDLFGIPITFFDGDIAEWVITGDMTALELTRMHNYFLVKYGI